MYNAILISCAVLMASSGIVMLIAQRHVKRQMETLAEVIAGTYACLDYMKEEADHTHEAIQHLINRQGYHIAIDKFNLSASRMQFICHRNQAVQHEDYEDASQFSKAISNIEELLSESEE